MTIFLFINEDTTLLKVRMPYFNCDLSKEEKLIRSSLAQLLSKKVEGSKDFRLLSITRLNVVCFTINVMEHNATLEEIQQFLNLVNEDGRAFFTQTMYKGIPGIRAAISNWRTDEKDIEIAWQVLNKAY